MRTPKRRFREISNHRKLSFHLKCDTEDQREYVLSTIQNKPTGNLNPQIYHSNLNPRPIWRSTDFYYIPTVLFYCISVSRLARTIEEPFGPADQ